MPLITQIKQTKKGRYALFCGEEFLFSVDEETYCLYAPAQGEEISESRLEELRTRSDNKKALEKAWTLLAGRNHGAAELREKLMRFYDEDTAQYAVSQLERMGYVDDDKVARELAEQLCNRKLYSVRRAAAYMQQKGYERELYELILSEYEQSEPERLRELILKKHINTPAQKAFAALLRLGFAASDIREALEYLRADND